MGNGKRVQSATIFAGATMLIYVLLYRWISATTHTFSAKQKAAA